MDEYRSIGKVCKCGQDKWFTRDEEILYKMICMNCYEVICIDKRDYVKSFKCELCGSTSGTLEETDDTVSVRCNVCQESYKKLEKNTIVNVRHEKAPVIQINNIPKCPTCQSTNIQKISAGRKLLGGLGFGLMSKTATSQFECKNCGYKW